MSLDLGANPSWSLFEWAATATTSAALGAGAFLWRLALRFDRISRAVIRQEAELEALKEANSSVAQRLADRLDLVHDDLCRLREAAASLPTRGDLHDIEARLGERVEALAMRIDNALDGRAV